MKKILLSTIILFVFKISNSQTNFKYLENLTPSIQRCVIPNLKTNEGFNSYYQTIEKVNYDPTNDLGEASEKINSARYNKTINDYKVKGINFAVDVTQDYLKPFLSKTPVGIFVNKSLDFLQQEITETSNSENKKELESSIEQAYSGYLKNFFTTNPNATSSEIAIHKQSFIKSGIVKNNNYPIIGKEIDKFLLDYVKANDSRFELLASNIKNQINAGIDEIKDLNGNIADLTTGQNKLKNNFAIFEEQSENKYNSFLKFQGEANKKFENVFKSIDEMNKEISSNSKLIKQNAKQISIIKQKANKNSVDIKLLKNLNNQNRELINENTFKVNVISDVLYNNVSAGDKIKLLETGVSNVKNKDREIKRLKSIQKLEQFSNKLAIANESIKLAQSLGLSEQDAKNASDVMQLAGIFANGASAYYTGNVMGGLQAVNSLISFGKKPEPDPEFTMIMQQFEQINLKLDAINLKLDGLSEKLDYLIEIEIELHKEVMFELENINDISLIIDKKSSYIIKLLTSECNVITGENIEIYKPIINDIKNAKTYSEYESIYNDDAIIGNILSCLYQNVSTTTVDDKSFVHNNRIDQSKQFKDYDLILEKYKSIYITKFKQEKSLSSYNYPVKYFNQVNKFAYIYNPSKEIINLENIEILMNPISIKQLFDLLVIFEPYFIFGKNEKSGFEPYPLDQFLNKINHTRRNRSVARHYKNLLKLCNISITQQNLLSGAPIISNLYTQIINNNNTLNKSTIDILNSNNSILKTNLSSYIIESEFLNNSNLYKKLNELQDSTGIGKPSETKINSLNNNFNYSNIKIVSKGNKVNGYQLYLEIKVKDKTFKLPITEASIIYQNEIIYPNDIYTLLEMKNEVLTKLAEFEFTNTISNDLPNKNLSKKITSSLIKNIIE